MSKQELIEGVLLLPAEDREQLYEMLGESLDKHSDAEKAEIQREWVKVAQRRSEELRSGKVKGIPAEQVFAEIHKLFDK